jgi:hypothetical protein
MLGDCRNRFSHLHDLGPVPPKNHEPSFSSCWSTGHDSLKCYYHLVSFKHFSASQMDRLHYSCCLSSDYGLHLCQIFFCLGTQWCLLGIRDKIRSRKNLFACSPNYLLGFGCWLLLLRNPDVQIILVIRRTLIQPIS